ncbi:Macrophage mannose receptor 1, partial [Dryobates pubescens]
TGGTLTSVEDVAESDFLAEHADLYRSKTSGFWIGIYRNMNGQLLWQDNSALEFANWGEGQPVGDLLEHCVELSAASGYWSTLPCHSQKGFICKKAKSAKKSQAPRHMNVWVVFTLLLIISLGMGVMIYFLIQVGTQRQTGGEARGSSTLVQYSYVLTGGDSESDATHKGKNEQSVV